MDRIYKYYDRSNEIFKGTWRFGFSRKNLRYLGYLIKHSKLKSVIVNDFLLVSTGLKYIVHSLKYNSGIYKLDFSDNTIRDIIYIEYLLKWNKSITKLILKNNYIGDGVKCHIDTFKYNSTLELLDISLNGGRKHNSTKKNYFNILLDSLKYSNSLIKLNLSNNILCNSDLTYVRNIIEHCDTLKTLNLSYNNFANFDTISNILKNNSTIENLIVKQCDISDDSIKNLMDTLKYNKTIESLHLTSYRDSPINMTYVADMLHYNSTIKALKIRFTLFHPLYSGYELTNKEKIVLKHFRDAFKSNHSLYYFNVGSMVISDPLIVNLINRNRCLKKLMVCAADILIKCKKRQYAKSYLPKYVYKDCFKKYFGKYDVPKLEHRKSIQSEFIKDKFVSFNFIEEN